MSWAASALLLALSAAPAAGEPPSGAAPSGAAPSDQTLLFFNARLALRERAPTEALKLWLLRNALAGRGSVGPHDEEFRSVVWAALGELGYCQDGFPDDDQGGAALWPIALHNSVVWAAARGPPPDRQAPFDAFEVGRQRRFISLHDVLSVGELRAATFFRTSCLRARGVMLTEFEAPSFDLTDRYFTGLLLRRLLTTALETVEREKFESVAVIEARIFDLDLALANLQARRVRREALAQRQRARSLGVTEQGAREAQAAAAKWPTDSEHAAFLRRCLSWSPGEWLTLSRQRRLFLFSQARPHAPDVETVERLLFGIIDALIERRAGDELEAWIGFLDAAESPARRAALTEGERGKRLLALDREAGFRERATVALHRGVAFLERGERQAALRSFSFAMAHAEESRAAEVSTALGRRWLSFVLSRYQTDAEVIATLKELVPRLEYNAVIEDLVWRAALRADAESFDRVVASARRGGAFDRRAERLRPLAHGDAGELLTLLRAAAEEEPHLTLRFVKQLIERLELEEANVRAANAPTLKLLAGLLEEFALAEGRHKAHLRTADELIGRLQAILEGLGHLEISVDGKARSLSPRHEAFAGNVRLAPADALPWSFRAPEPDAPSPFKPLTLVPVEWRGPQGELVFGWRLGE